MSPNSTAVVLNHFKNAS